MKETHSCFLLAESNGGAKTMESAALKQKTQGI